MCMIIHGVEKGVPAFSKMILHLNYHLPHTFLTEKPLAVLSKRTLSCNIQCFRTSRHTPIRRASPTETAQLPASGSGRTSRVSRAEAQKALFNYLHSTRSFDFVDAEHICRNSPNFLQKLLSEVDHEQDVTRSLSRYFRFYPINEFEPFLESLGLSPSEVSVLLPRNLMFLSDDCLLIANFHVLRNYGIPRNKIGKVYMEAKEVFGYSFGILASKLQSYEALGLSKYAVCKLVISCPTLLVGEVKGEFVRLLDKLGKLGIKNDWIKRYLNGGKAHNWNRVLDTMEFLNRVGYSDEDIKSLFRKHPMLLSEGPGKKIYAMVGCLHKLGLKTDEICQLISENPQILSQKFAKNLRQAVRFLFNIGMGLEDIAYIVFAHTKQMGSHSYFGPKTVLRKLKIKRDVLCQIICEDPLKFFSLASKSTTNFEPGGDQNACMMLEKTAFLLRIGYKDNSEELVKALKLFRGRGDQLQERFDCLVRAGLDYNVVANMIKEAPSVLNQSKDVIEKKLGYLQIYLGYPLESVAKFPSYLCYDLQRINLRFSMYAWLLQRSAAKPQLSLSTILACSDKRFVKYFVNIHPEGPATWESLQKPTLRS